MCTNNILAEEQLKKKAVNSGRTRDKERRVLFSGGCTGVESQMDS